MAKRTAYYRTHKECASAGANLHRRICAVQAAAQQFAALTEFTRDPDGRSLGDDVEEVAIALETGAEDLAAHLRWHLGVTCRPGAKGAATREKKEAFLLEGDTYSVALIRLVSAMLARHGVEWLTDAQLDDLVNEVVSQERMRGRINRTNRARSKVAA